MLEEPSSESEPRKKDNRFLKTFLLYVAAFIVLGLGVWLYVERPSLDFFTSKDYSDPGDYASLRQLQNVFPFTIYAPLKVPFGYFLESEGIMPIHVEDPDVQTLSLHYTVGREEDSFLVEEMTFDDIIMVYKQTKKVFFAEVEENNDVKKITESGQEMYIYQSTIISYGGIRQHGIVIWLDKGDVMVKIKYLGVDEWSEEDIIATALSVESVGIEEINQEE